MMIDNIVNSVVNELKDKLFIGIEASGRHVHLKRSDVEALFGHGYKLTPVKDLSQPGQYACEERVTLTGPRGDINNVVILGPERGSSQVEISLTDALALGVKVPIRLSGDIKDTPGIMLKNPKNGKSITLNNGLIVAKRHIHMTPQDAMKFEVENGEIVKLKVFGERPLIFDDVDVRVSKNFSTVVHLDYDEANACGLYKNSKGIIINKARG